MYFFQLYVVLQCQVLQFKCFRIKFYVSPIIKYNFPELNGRNRNDWGRRGNIFLF